jgi:hypothetical protein
MSTATRRPTPVDPLEGETLLTLSEVTKRFPGHKGSGSRLSYTTVLRWVINGCRSVGGQNVKLEAVRNGQRWLTSVEALARFNAALGQVDPAPKPESPKRRARRMAAVNAELDALGL